MSNPVVLEPTETEGIVIREKKPYWVYLEPFQQGCKVQFASPNADHTKAASWQDWDTITPECPMIPVPGGDFVVFRLLATTAGSTGYKSISEVPIFR